MVCYYKVRQLFYYKVRQVLLQSATGITKCDNFITKYDSTGAPCHLIVLSIHHNSFVQEDRYGPLLFNCSRQFTNSTQNEYKYLTLFVFQKSSLTGFSQTYYSPIKSKLEASTSPPLPPPPPSPSFSGKPRAFDCFSVPGGGEFDLCLVGVGKLEP